MKSIIIFLSLFIALSGCISSQPESTPVTEVPTTVITTVPEPTFVHPSIVHTESPVPTATIYTNVLQTPSPYQDPIIGSWQLQNAPYSGTAIFVNGGNGHLEVGDLMLVTQRNFVWSNETDHYNVNIEGNEATIMLYDNGTMISSVLPNGSYLIRGAP